MREVSFSVQSGQIAALVGKSGCGKTTTLKMINRLIEPSSGEIWVGGKKASELDVISWRRRIGYVIQKAGLLPHLTIEENISLLSKVLAKDKNWIKKRVQQLMHTIQLPYEDYADRYPLQLSGGQQQRVGIARALMENPDVILMDEPFGALDPMTKADLHQEFLDLNQKFNKTIVIVTHDLREAFKLASHIMIMNEGVIVQQGSEKQIKSQPVNEFVQKFLKGHL